MRKNKWGNKRTKYNGRNYHSKLESEYAMYLDLLLKTGAIESWVPQFKIRYYTKAHLFSYIANVVIKGKNVKVPTLMARRFERAGVGLHKNARVDNTYSHPIVRNDGVDYVLVPDPLNPEITNVSAIGRHFDYVADFLVTYADGHMELVDTKSMPLQKEPMFKLKKRLIESRFPSLTIILVDKVPKLI